MTSKGYIDDFYKQSGKCGKDGNLSHSLLIYSPDDFPRLLKSLYSNESGNSKNKNSKS